MRLDQVETALNLARGKSYFAASLDNGEHFCFPLPVKVSVIDTVPDCLIVVEDGPAVHLIDAARVVKIIFEDEIVRPEREPLPEPTRFDFRRFWS